MIDPRGSSFKNFLLRSSIATLKIFKKKKIFFSRKKLFKRIFPSFLSNVSIRITRVLYNLLNFDLDSRESFQFFFFIQPSKRVQYTNNSHSSSNQLKLGSITSIRYSDIRNQKSIVQNPRGSPDVFRSGCTPHPFARRCDYV